MYNIWLGKIIKGNIKVLAIPVSNVELIIIDNYLAARLHLVMGHGLDGYDRGLLTIGAHYEEVGL